MPFCQVQTTPRWWETSHSSAKGSLVFFVKGLIWKTTSHNKDLYMRSCAFPSAFPTFFYLGWLYWQICWFCHEVRSELQQIRGGWPHFVGATKGKGVPGVSTFRCLRLWLMGVMFFWGEGGTLTIIVGWIYLQKKWQLHEICDSQLNSVLSLVFVDFEGVYTPREMCSSVALTSKC